jgi:hypothetical protein
LAAQDFGHLILSSGTLKKPPPTMSFYTDIVALSAYAELAREQVESQD